MIQVKLKYTLYHGDIFEKNVFSLFHAASNSSKKIIRSRKRTRNLKSRKETVRKAAVQRGEEHVTRNGNIIPKRQFTVQTNCKCRKSCSQNINIFRQKQIFDEFYCFENWSQKTLFLRSLVNSANLKENLDPIKKKQEVSHEYRLKDENGISFQVCLHFLLTCLQISKDTLLRTIKSQISNPNAVDQRGSFPNRKTEPEDLSYLHNFIEKFPTYNSHYSSSKSDSNIKYLSPCLNIVRMYREYTMACEVEGMTKLSEWMFRNVFNTQFNLRFKPLKVDTCKTCDGIENKIKSSDGIDLERFSKEKDDHLKMVQKYKQTYTKTIEYAKKPNSKIEIRTFDLQRALELPHLSTSIAYYSRQL